MGQNKYIFSQKPQNPPENGFGGGSGQFSALISGKTSKIVVKFRGGGVLRIDPYENCKKGRGVSIKKSVFEVDCAKNPLGM